MKTGDAHEGNTSVKSEEAYFALDFTVNIAVDTCIL